MRFEIEAGGNMQNFWQDIRYAFRMMVKNPGFTSVAVLTLALGIGANSAIFSVVNGVLLKPLPFKDPSRLAIVRNENFKEGGKLDPISFPNYEDIRNQSQSFDEMTAITPVWNFGLTGDGEPEHVTGFWVSASFFDLLGVRPILGRAFQESEDKPGKEDLALISHSLWLRHFGADPNVCGKTITLDSRKTTIIGVMPGGFHFLEDVDLWLPLQLNPVIPRGRAVRFLTVVGHLAPGASFDQAGTEVATITRQLEQQYPEINTGLGGNVVSLHKEITGKVRPALLVLFGVVGFVLLIACANLANLLVARAAAREKEIAVRTALGASRLRLIRQFLTESVTLSLVGGAAGLLLSLWGVSLLRALSPKNLPRLDEIVIDSQVLGFTLIISLLTGIIFGLAPAMQFSKSSLTESLKEGGRTSFASGRGRLRSLLVVSEVALALVLLIGAGLMIRSFSRLLQVNPGFNQENLLTMQIMLPEQEQYRQSARRAAFYDQLFERIASLPGVQAVGGTTRLPLGNMDGVTTTLEIEGQPVPEGERPEVEFRRVSKDYFQAMGIPLKEGRVFEERDLPDSPRVGLVTESAARRFWPGEDPLGKRIRFFGDPNAPWWTIVGVVGDVNHFGLDVAARPEVYMYFKQGPPVSPFIAIRTTGDPSALVSNVRQQMLGLEKELTIYNVAPMTDLISESVSDRRFNMLLVAMFSAIALILASIGIYGVISYSVRQRTHEIGVRMALGAKTGDILRLVVGQGMALILTGILSGLAASYALTRVMSSLLFGVSATDPMTFVMVPMILTGVALAACFVPARRATRIDPMEALRYE